MEKPDDGLPAYGFVKIKTVLEMLDGISRTTLDREIKDGLFPPPIHITRKSLGWPVEVIREFFNEKRRQQKELAGIKRFNAPA